MNPLSAAPFQGSWPGKTRSGYHRNVESSTGLGSTARPPWALVGIEKIVPRDRDLAVFLNLLARSATSQQLTVYTQFINGPRADAQP